MSALTPHIRVLRAVAKALFDASDETKENCGPVLATFALSLSSALLTAADALEAEERALEERLSGPQPKGH